LSYPVRDLDEALTFYVGTLGAVVGRREAEWADIGLFGAQLTLQHVPADVPSPMPRSRHFGATLPRDVWEQLVEGLSNFVEPPRLRHEGSDREERKAMIADPSGNLIELKTYRDPRAVLGDLAA
jgi:hypothetical protein